VVSTVFTVALLGAAVYLYFKSSGGSGGAASSSAASSGGDSKQFDDADDPLAEARKIMDKYK